jgi:hypothetical protein
MFNKIDCHEISSEHTQVEPWTKPHKFELFVFDCSNTPCLREDTVLVPASGSIMPRKFTIIQWTARAVDTMGNGYFRRGKVATSRFKGRAESQSVRLRYSVLTDPACTLVNILLLPTRGSAFLHASMIH